MCFLLHQFPFKMVEGDRLSSPASNQKCDTVALYHVLIPELYQVYVAMRKVKSSSVLYGMLLNKYHMKQDPSLNPEIVYKMGCTKAFWVAIYYFTASNES